MVDRLLYPVMMFSVVVALASCGKADLKKVSSQIAAKVNGDEISVHQINSAIARSNNGAPDQAKQTAAQVLERIIDQELLVQKAREAKLDRDPQVMQEIEGAKRQILAQAYLERAVSAAPKERPEEVKEFYRRNPVLFERRRMYRFQELAVAAPQGKLDALKAEAAVAKNLNDVAGWLKSQKLSFNVATSTKPSEQVPLEILPQVSDMKDGQIAVFPTPHGASVLQLMQSQEAPLSEKQATPIIEQFLANRKRIELAQAEVKKLREKANIEYVGDFGTTRPQTTAQPGSSSATASLFPGRDEGKIARDLSSGPR
ncbi:MAG: peptidyl-prolyl cis-trans isomerase, EpsD family [Betaproteobacteria bacterium]|nr:MAG: peptidyl-prolyl cis-trans isomerase, EpsD family [Betaproteobacteria bacterium]